MKVTLTIQGVEVLELAEAPAPGASAVAFAGSCQLCGASPFYVAGAGKRIESHDTYAAEASCLACKGRVGVLRVQLSTIFGLEEDERVIHGSACKVY